MLSAYARFVVRHSYIVLFIVSVISTILTIIPLVFHNLPSFADPIIGFETRGTILADRFIAWENLIDETRPSKRLAVDPKEIEDQLRMNYSYHNRIRPERPRSGQARPIKKKGWKKKKINNNSSNFERIIYNSPDSNISDDHVHWGYGKNVSFGDEDDTLFLKYYTRKMWVSLKEMQRGPTKVVNFNYASGTCGPPVSNYAHLVVSNTDNTSLLTYENVIKMCLLQSTLLEIGDSIYQEMCQRSTNSEEICCPMWSVPNYIALMSAKNSCENLTRDDVSKAVSVLGKCAGYFHNFTLMASCELDRCKVPKYCSQYDAVYNLLFYLIDAEAFSPPHYTQTIVKNVMLFLPLPASSTVLPYYKKLKSSNLSYESLVIPAIDFGLKNALFDIWIIQDTWLVGLGGIFVFLWVWIYTKSLVLAVLLFTAVTYSLGIAYFMYVYVFNLEFFPFMNLLVIVVVIGIGADDAFLYVKVWRMVSEQLIRDNVVSQENGLSEIKNISSAGETILTQTVEETLKHSMVTMFITTITTAAAFFASYVSYIPAINCFSVFAGTAVLVNFLLMVMWLPVSVYIVDVKWCVTRRNILDVLSNRVNEVLNDIRVILNKIIIACVTKLHIVFVILLGALGIGSAIVVFYSPGLRLPDSKQFQLFQYSHPFEQYDLQYRDKFLFEKFGKDIGTGSKMPLRWVWGVKALDNGNHMDPISMGKLEFNEQFSISDPNSQVWLLQFCSKLKSQPFYERTLGPLLPNCFIETFKMFMSRRCIDVVDKIDRSPCCETSRFPYKKEVFELCIIKAMETLYQTPREIFIPGVAGPKFLRSSSPPKISAMVIEFESVVPYSMSYTAMDNFFSQLENWTKEVMKTAPPGLKCGWFLSDLQFYDLQKTLANGTVLALILSISLGFVVLLPATFNIIVSVCAVLAIIFSTTVTIAILVLNDWKLNILESVAISTSAGLAVDFSLHYALSYMNASGTKSARVLYALSVSVGPTAAAALTTGSAGIFLLKSHLLPYTQIGTFLALIMSVSWTYATFFLCSLLYIFGKKSGKDSTSHERKSVSRVSSICSELPNLESHELEHLADSNRTNITHSQSPSSISATTVVLHDDYDNPHNKNEQKISITSNLVCDND